MPHLHLGIPTGIVGLPGSAEPEQLSLFEGVGVIDLAGLRMERAAIALRKRAPLTRRAYGFDWADFSGWCEQAGRRPLPASSDTLTLYCVSAAQAGRSVATIARRLAAIASQHLAAGHPSPVDADVREVLFGLRRKLGTAPRNAKRALTPEDLRLVLGFLGEGPRAARDRALLLLGFASSLRRSELAGLQVSDVREVKEGLIIRLRRSKTDQEGAGRELGIHRGGSEGTDPVRAWCGWMKERGAWPGPLFTTVDESGRVVRRAMSGESIAVAIKRCVAAAGLDPARYSGHSLRAGMATAAAANGASDRSIMARTGHRSADMVSRYVRHGNLFASDPLQGVL